MGSTAERWPEFSIGRLGELCRLQQQCDCFADDMTKRFLQYAIFSVYLDCRQAGMSEGAREVLAEWAPGVVKVPRAGTRSF